MRRVFAVLLVSQLLGCFVFEELDASRDQLDNPTFEKAKPKPSPAKARATANDPEASPQERLSSWWQGARSVNSGSVDEGMVACELGGKTQFMRREDCLSRGGNAGAVR